MANIDILNLDSYTGKSNGDPLAATTWNSLLGTIQNKINEIIRSLDGHIPNNDSELLIINNKAYYSSANDPLSIDITDLLVSENTNDDNELLVTGDEVIISGKLYGNIYASLDTAPSDDLRIRLNNAEIINPNNCPAIDYLINNVSNNGFKGLTISVDEDTTNYVINTYEAPSADGLKGAIHSDHDLTIKGVGYLAINNNCGHGIKGSTVELAGTHIYIDAIHDGIHGKYIYIDDGCFAFENVNDCFGISADGELILFHMLDIVYNNISGKVYDTDLGIGYYVQTPKYYEDLVEGNLISDNMTNLPYKYNSDGNPSPPLATVTGYNSKSDMESETNGTVIQKTTITITPDDEEPYLISIYSAEYNFITVENGVLDATLYISDTYDQKVNIYVNNIYFSAHDSTNNFVYYGRDTDRVKLIFRGINYIENTYLGELSNPDGIKSEKDIEIELKRGSITEIHKFDDGIDGNAVKITDSTGTLLVYNCESRGIKASTLVIGPGASEAGGIITYSTDTEMNGIVISKYNCTVNRPSIISTLSEQTIKTTGYADIYCRLGKKLTKGSFGTKKEQLKGSIIVGTIGATIKLDFDNSPNIYYNLCLTTNNIVNGLGNTDESYLAYTVEKQSIPYSNWIIPYLND